jgi:hypothetical protein
MGWNPFKSEEVTRVATSVSRLIDNDAVPDAVKSGSIKALFSDGNVADYVMEELVASIGMRAEKMYRYAENQYTWGMPSGEIYSANQARPQVEAFLEQAEGAQIAIEYSHYGSPNVQHMGWMALMDDHGYNPDTNQLANLTTQKGTPVYLKDMVIVVPESQLATLDKAMLEQWGISAAAGYTPQRPASGPELAPYTAHTPIAISSAATELHLVVSYVWKMGATVMEDSFTLSHAAFDYRDGYFMTKYVVGTETKYWAYLNKSGVHSELDNIFVDGPAESGSYFPFTYFRYAKSSTSSNKTTQAYKTSKKMMKTLGLDFDAVGAAVDENPDIADIEQAMLVFAVPPVSTNKQENRYLFDYFNTLREATEQDNSAAVAQSLRVLGGGSGFQWGSSAHTVIIQDQRFKKALSHSGIYKRIRAGVIGSVDTYTSAFETINVEQAVSNFETGELYTEIVPTKTHTYRHQISANMYEEIVVIGLQMTYYIYGGYNTVGDETDSILLIPIDKTVSEDYSISDREILYSRALHFVFNSRVVTKVKWYQQTWFRVFLIIVAIVLTVIDMGSDGGSWIATALELTGTEAIVATVIFNLVVGMVIMPKVFKVFVKVFGQDVATLVAIAAVLYGGYSLLQNGMAGVPTAADMLMLSSGISNAVLESKMYDLLDQRDELQTWMDDQTKSLETANDLLDKQTILSPFVIFGEKPEEFYNRTVHYGNIGTLGINAISSYVDIALTLPKVNDTLGEPIYG